MPISYGLNGNSSTIKNEVKDEVVVQDSLGHGGMGGGSSIVASESGFGRHNGNMWLGVYFGGVEKGWHQTPVHVRIMLEAKDTASNSGVLYINVMEAIWLRPPQRPSMMGESVPVKLEI